ncbi:SRPBCC family protein [Arthrobacter sp. CAU 1506]|uniref:SRPBCC family protein n=1 Tax=Arthrobacter sp. CAU 1506 TaxID=2560052 RepID=UPI0010ABE6BE|nr:SRPBCC family protein [Arthrobacter sp. CAU 1506]TJY69195.1 SRPBCC family protein [Arthrobacter sp. CAU 1506]
MQTVEETIDVAVPVRTAYDQWTQFESFSNFMSGVESVTQLTDTTNHWKTKIGGVEREFDTEIVEQQPDQRIAWRSVDGKSHAGVVTFSQLGADSTQVSVRFEWDPETFTEKAGAALNLDDRQVKSDMKKFKEFIETRGTETGAWRGEVNDSGPTGTQL